VHVCFFDYFSLIPWLARLQGIRSIIYEELNSGMLRATSWKKQLIRLRTLITTFPLLRVVAVSEFIKQDLVRRGIAPDKIVVKYLGVDEERFKPLPGNRDRLIAEYSIKPNELIMSSVTVLRPFKSPETLVRACALLAQRNIPFRLFVAGDGAMLDDLKLMSQESGTANRIHWLGFCKDPASLVQASDLFLIASIGEAGGLALLEAMACGVPIIGSRSGVTVEYVEDGRTGLLATPQDPESFADAIMKVADDRELLRKMSINSRERALRYFTVDIDVQNTLRLYESLWNH